MKIQAKNAMNKTGIWFLADGRRYSEQISADERKCIFKISVYQL